MTLANLTTAAFGMRGCRLTSSSEKSLDQP